jgi:hypothetical protein
VGDTLGQDFAHILGRDLDALADQIHRYPSDETLWSVAPGTTNSAGTLAIHAVGNLEHFVGSVLGGSGYVRDRDAEFGERGLSREEILDRIGRCKHVVTSTLEGLSDEAAKDPYPGALPPHMSGASTHKFLAHLATHLMWHLGQIDYHRRIQGASDHGRAPPPSDGPGVP